MSKSTTHYLSRTMQREKWHRRMLRRRAAHLAKRRKREEWQQDMQSALDVIERLRAQGLIPPRRG